MGQFISVAAVSLLLLAATACSSDDDSKGMGDAPVATTTSGVRGGDDSPATITNMPDHYGNIATKCIAGAKPWRVIEGTNTDYTGSNFVVVQDPKACGGDWVPGARYVPASSSKGMESPDDDS
jgi:hypothetical protein